MFNCYLSRSMRLPPLHLLSYLIVLSFANSLPYLNAQSGQPDMEILGRQDRIEIPFELINDFIVVNVLMDNWLPLRFLIDTGAENSVIVDKKLSDFLNLNYQREFRITGADRKQEMIAYLASGVNFRLANRILAINRNMLVLAENYFHFERITGTPIHGILGADFLMRFVVEFDFKQQKMRLFEPRSYQPSKKQHALDATFHRNRAYVEVPISVTGRKTRSRRMLIDTGAGLYVLLHSGLQPEDQELPQRIISTPIAHGLGGEVDGNVGRAKSLTLGEQSLDNVVTYFQQLDPDSIDTKQGLYRDGLLGNSLLKRFNLTIDYVHQQVYLYPTARWKRKITFDRSGLLISATGPQLNRFVVSGVLPDSPAAEAGLLVGDRIKSINGLSCDFLSLDQLLRKLEQKPSKRIKLQIRRINTAKEVEFKLRDLI